METDVQTPEGDTLNSEGAKTEGKPSLEESLAAVPDEGLRNYLLEEVRGARREAKNLRDRLQAATPALTELEELKKAQMSEAEKLAAERDKAKQEAEALRTRLVGTTVKSLASDFVDAEDALSALGDLSKYVKNGDIDADSIGSDLKALLERKPHWAKEKKTTVPVNPAQGSSATGQQNATGQLTEAEVASMSQPEIAKAMKEGRLKNLLASK